MRLTGLAALPLEIFNRRSKNREGMAVNIVSHMSYLLNIIFFFIELLYKNMEVMCWSEYQIFFHRHPEMSGIK